MWSLFAKMVGEFSEESLTTKPAGFFFTSFFGGGSSSGGGGSGVAGAGVGEDLGGVGNRDRKLEDALNTLSGGALVHLQEQKFDSLIASVCDEVGNFKWQCHTYPERKLAVALLVRDLHANNALPRGSVEGECTCKFDSNLEVPLFVCVYYFLRLGMIKAAIEALRKTRSELHFTDEDNICEILEDAIKTLEAFTSGSGSERFPGMTAVGDHHFGSPTPPEVLSRLLDKNKEYASTNIPKFAENDPYFLLVFKLLGLSQPDEIFDAQDRLASESIGTVGLSPKERENYAFSLEDYMWSNVFCCHYSRTTAVMAARAEQSKTASRSRSSSFAMSARSGSGGSFYGASSVYSATGSASSSAPISISSPLDEHTEHAMFRRIVKAGGATYFDADGAKPFNYCRLLLCCHRFGDAVRHLYLNKQYLPAAALAGVCLYYGLLVSHLPLTCNPHSSRSSLAIDTSSFSHGAESGEGGGGGSGAEGGEDEEYEVDAMIGGTSAADPTPAQLIFDCVTQNHMLARSLTADEAANFLVLLGPPRSASSKLQRNAPVRAYSSSHGTNDKLAAMVRGAHAAFSECFEKLLISTGEAEMASLVGSQRAKAARRRQGGGETLLKQYLDEEGRVLQAGGSKLKNSLKKLLEFGEFVDECKKGEFYEADRILDRLLCWSTTGAGDVFLNIPDASELFLDVDPKLENVHQCVLSFALEMTRRLKEEAKRGGNAHKKEIMYEQRKDWLLALKTRLEATAQALSTRPSLQSSFHELNSRSGGLLVSPRTPRTPSGH